MTKEQKTFYEANGYVKIPALFDSKEIAKILRWADEVASWPPREDCWMHHYEVPISGEGSPQLSRTENVASHHAELGDVFLNGPLAEVAGDALDETAVLYKDKLNYKAAKGAGYAAHQDAPAYAQVNFHATCLLALDTATVDNGCLEFASFPASRKEYIGLTSEGIIEKQVASKLAFQPVETEPGDVVVFSSYVPHRSGANHSDKPRRLFYLTYNKESEGDLREAYYIDKRQHMQEGRLSMIGHFEGQLVKAEEASSPPARGAETMATIEEMFEKRGTILYDDFSTQEEHALMTAYMARKHGATDRHLVAAFLHDLGHLLLDEHAGRDDFLQHDKKHEDIGHRFLRRAFPEDITELVRLHVDAKRYLCATDSAYYNGLSTASQASLALQGGPFSADEALQWGAQPFAEEAAQLRRWEDEGKQLWKSGAVTAADLPSRAELLELSRQALRA